ncbi:hypothetical protein IQ266_00630 [filamentous cyanobacterium LEGE 11480]|uniref:Uncharacterized protein n=1 Tax=Romeriopsis navalis LEGE 11480 TaxID=2777977 RepID=A0A928VLL5_9CYAN|nr:hypothetical protein [Romeriopsis navalis]MBE9028259.1 hypothetical protein [Romeriopsis navalis LEGE 11480]
MMSQTEFDQLIAQLNPKDLSPEQVRALMKITTEAIAHLANTKQLGNVGANPPQIDRP